MVALKSNVHVLSFLWDFAVDGGAIGTYNTKLKPPAQSVFISAFVDILTPGISIGSQIDFYNAGTPVGSLGGIPAPIILMDRAFINYMNTFAAPSYNQLNGEALLMDISLNPFTAGKVKFHFFCVEAKV